MAKFKLEMTSYPPTDADRWQPPGPSFGDILDHLEERLATALDCRREVAERASRRR